MPYIGNNHIAGDHTNNFKVLDDISSFTATFDGSATSVVDTTNNTIRVVEHRFIQGQRVTYTNGGGGNIGGLTTGTAYFVIFDSASTIKLATSASNAANSTAINLSAVGSGSSHTLNAAFDGVNTKFKLTHGSGTGARLNNATQINVAINNVLQRPNLDPNNFTDGFALEDNHKIVFQTAPTSEDIFWGSIIANTLTTFDISDHKIDTFTGDGSTTEFTLSHTPANNESLMVTINGVLQHPSNASTARAYTLIASIIQFTAAPGVGDEIQVRHMGFAGATTADVSGFYGRTGNVVLTSNDHITTGNINAGIVTASSFDGTFSSNIGGSNANFTGIVTAGTFKGGNIDAVDGAFSGNVTIGGTLTYEDVTNIDSVGIITARDGIDCNADLDVDGHTNLDNVSVAGLTTFSNKIKASFGSGSRGIQVGTNCIIQDQGNILIENTGAGTMYLKSRAVQIRDRSNNNIASFSETAGSGLFHHSGSSIKLKTTATGIEIPEDLDVDGHTNLDNVNIAGVTTTTGNIHLNTGAKVGFHTDSNTFIGQDNLDRLDFNAGGKRLVSIVEGLNLPALLVDDSGVNTGQGNQGSGYNANANANDIVVGNISSGNHGMTIISPSSGYGNIQFSDGSGGGLDATRGSIIFTHSDNKLNLKSKIGSIALTHKDDEKLVTTDAGISIPKDLDVDGHTNLDNVSVAGVSTFSDNININDSKVIYVGTDNDLRISHDPTHTVSFIQNTGPLQIQSDDLRLYNYSTADLYLRAQTNAAVQLFYDYSNHNTPKLATTATGVTIDGTVAAGGANLQSTGGDLINVTSTNAASRSTIKFNTNGNDWEIGARGSSADNPNNFYIFDNTTTSYRMLINSSGNVSIAKDLDVDGHTNLDNVSIAGITTFSNRAYLAHDLTITGTAPRVIFTDSNNNSDYRINVDAGNFEVQDITNSYATRFLINSSGNIGIGTDNPQCLLDISKDVSGGVNFVDIRNHHPSGGAALRVKTQGNYASPTYVGLLGASDSGGSIRVGSVSNHPVEIITNNNAKATMTAGGQLLLGTTSPNTFNGVGGVSNLVVAGSTADTDITDNSGASLTISNTDGTANNTAGLHFAREDNDGAPHYSGASVVAQFKETMNTGHYPKADLAFLTSTANNNAPSEKMRLSADGNLSINTTANVQKLRVYDSRGAAGYKTALFESNDTANGTRIVFANTGSTSGRGLGINVGGQTYGPGQDRASFGWYNPDNTFSYLNALTLTADGVMAHGPFASFAYSNLTAFFNVHNGARVSVGGANQYAAPKGGFCDNARYELEASLISYSTSAQQTIQAQNGAQLKISNSRNNWSYYNNLPNYLLGHAATDCINTSNYTLTLKATMTVFLQRSNGWNAVPLSGWELLESNTGIGPGSNDSRLYVKTLAAGSYSNWDSDSAMYFFVL